MDKSGKIGLSQKSFYFWIVWVYSMPGMYQLKWLVFWSFRLRSKKCVLHNSYLDCVFELPLSFVIMAYHMFSTSFRFDYWRRWTLLFDGKKERKKVCKTRTKIFFTITPIISCPHMHLNALESIYSEKESIYSEKKLNLSKNKGKLISEKNSLWSFHLK